MHHQAIINTTHNWVQNLVIDLNLCPFARKELVNNRIRFTLSEVDTPDELLAVLEEELTRLTSDHGIETTLLIHPCVLQDFYDYNDFLVEADALLVALGLDGVYQIASFHPEYQFAGTEPDDVENTTNRAPYPMLHLLREASLEKAIERYPDTENIPRHNIERVTRLGSEKMAALLLACKQDEPIQEAKQPPES